MTVYTPQHEQISGANLTGTSGDANRTYTLANSNAILAQMMIIRAEAPLQPVVNYTLDTNTDIVTFLGPVWDDQPITIDYWTEDTSSIVGDNYCTTLDAVRYSGIGVEVFMENLGTGDGSEDSYDTKNGNIIANSYSLKYGTSGSNSLSTLAEGTHYSIEKNSGSILLTSAGVTAINGKVLYINYTHCPKMSDTVLNSFLSAASREVEYVTGNYYSTVKSTTEFFDGYDSGYPHTDQPFGTEYDPSPEFELKYKDIASITSVQFLDNTGTVSSSVDSDYIQYEDTGRVILTNKATIPNGKKNIKIIYTHGSSSVPALVTELAALITAKMGLVNISGSGYDDVTSYQVGRFSATVGEAYVNIREVLAQVNARIDEISIKLGGNFGCA